MFSYKDISTYVYIYICSPTDVSQYRWDQKRSASPMLGFSIPVLQHLFHRDVGDQQRQCLILATGCLPETPAAAASHWAVLLGRGDLTRHRVNLLQHVSISRFSILFIPKCTGWDFNPKWTGIYDIYLRYRIDIPIKMRLAAASIAASRS